MTSGIILLKLLELLGNGTGCYFEGPDEFASASIAVRFANVLLGFSRMRKNDSDTNAAFVRHDSTFEV